MFYAINLIKKEFTGYSCEKISSKDRIWAQKEHIGFVELDKKPEESKDVMDIIEIRKPNEKEIKLATTKLGNIIIEKKIYDDYPEEKQSQDKGWKDYYETTVIGVSKMLNKPVTTDELKIDIMNAVIGFYEGKVSLESFIENKPKELTEAYTKLFKIGVRLSWTKKTIDSAIIEAKTGKSNYIDFPIIG